MQILYTKHAKFQMEERDISETEVNKTILQPTEVIKSSGGRLVAQRIYRKGKIRMLLRVFFEKTDSKCTIITAYWTSKINKYFSREVQ